MDNKRAKGIVTTSIIGIIGNLLLVGVKITIGLITASSSIISDAINNLSDALSSLITAVGTKLSNKRPNKDHPFGYGRIEYLTSTVVAALILFAGGVAIYESVLSLINKEETEYSLVSFIIIGIAIVFKVALGIFFRLRGKKYDSQALKNSGTDALFDAILSTGTFIAMFVSYFAHVYIEGYIGIFIGLFILRAGFTAMKESLSPILGERIDDRLAREIKAAICEHPSIKGAYDLIVNNYGESKKIGSVHIEVDDTMTAKEIYALEREIQFFVYDKYGIIMTVGVYASNESSPLAKKIKADALRLVGQHDGILEFHGFYFDEPNGVVSFDIIVDFESKEKPDDIVAQIKKGLEELYPSLIFYIILDQDFAA